MIVDFFVDIVKKQGSFIGPNLPENSEFVKPCGDHIWAFAMAPIHKKWASHKAKKVKENNQCVYILR